MLSDCDGFYSLPPDLPRNLCHFICVTALLSVGWLVVLLFYVHGKHLRSCRDGQLT